MKKISLLYAFSLTLILSFFILSSCTNKQGPIKILLVDGFSNHDWQHTTRCIQAILTQSDDFDVSLSTYPIDGNPKEIETWNPQFENYDVVIQTCNNLGNGVRWPKRVEAALETYVSNGGGLFIYHGANNAFPNWEAYNKMIGLGWRSEDFGWAITVNEDGTVVRVPAGKNLGEKTGTSHGPRINARLTRMGSHPIHAGFPRQWVAADIEVYRYARGPAENLTVLSYAKDALLELNFPVEWTTTYGKGNVYNSTLGHVWKDQDEPLGVRCAGFQTLLQRTVRWLAKREVGPVPEDFPTGDAPRLRPYPVSQDAQSTFDLDEQEQQIRSLIDQYSRARETKDAELLTSILVKDIDQLVSSGTWRRGFDEALKGMMQSSTSRPGSRTLTVENIRFLNPGSAIADARYEVTNTDGSVRKMWSTFIVTHEVNRWKIAAIRNMLPAR